MNKNQIKYGSLISYGLIMLNIIIGLIYTPWILEVVGSSDYGLYTLSTSLIALFLLDFGMSAAVTRFLANYRARNNQELINSFVGLAIKIYLGICLTLAFVLWILFLNLDSIYVNLSINELESFKIVYVITATFVVVSFPVNICNGILNAYEQYISLKMSDVLNKVFTVVVTIIMLCLDGGLYSLIFINGLFNLLTLILKSILIKKKTPIKIDFHRNSNLLVKEIFSFSIWTTVQTISNQMIFNLVPTILAMVSNTFAITLYGFAKVIEGYVYNITQAINGLFLPSISRTLVKSDNAENTLPIMIQVGRLNQSIISLLLIGLIVLGKEFTYLWIGEEFGDLYYCIIALVCPYFFSASQQIANTSIVVLNKVKFHAIINLTTGILNLILCYFVSQIYGVVGTCCVISVILFLRIFVLNVVYYCVLKINIWSFFKECHIKMFPGICISLVLSATLQIIVSSKFLTISWSCFVIKGVMICMLYFIVMWKLGWNETEKNIIRTLLKNKTQLEENE